MNNPESSAEDNLTQAKQQFKQGSYQECLKLLPNQDIRAPLMVRTPDYKSCLSSMFFILFI